MLHDLNSDAPAAAEFLQQGFRLPPVIVIDGEAVEGFQPERIEALLEAARQREAGADR